VVAIAQRTERRPAVKFVLTYTVRPGASASENVESAKASMKLLSSWSPSPSYTIHQWVERCDGNGGFAVTEGDDPGQMYKDLSTWTPWLEFQLYPVIDILESTPLAEEAIAIAQSVL
jgi:Protein of unknown function (DUF3303)